MTAPLRDRLIRAVELATGRPLAVERERLPAADGVELERFTFASASGPVRLEWAEPLIDIAGKWHPAIGADRSLTADWGKPFDSYATLNAPVYALFSAAGENRLTFALSDAINLIRIQVQVEEDTAEACCRAVLFDTPASDASTERPSVIVRRDWRPTGYAHALADVAKWWADMEDYRPARVPEASWEPVYSTWYGFHQALSPEEIEEDCRRARELGCGVVIVDDGWQCDDSNKGYDYCGDWNPAPSKFPDFPAHVRRVRESGLRYLLWFSAPYAGLKSRARATFAGKLLPKPFHLADCLDPRHADVREYLVGCYRRAVEEWGVDGLKLDFVDRFTAEGPGEAAALADHASVPRAVDTLMTAILRTLRETKPDVLIEFRQKYTGPAMRKYGNMLRASDCPNDGLGNRLRTLDVRLLAGRTPVHSDMIMWHPEERPEQVAKQLWAALFSVPQISVRPGRLTAAQERVLRFFLGFWKRHRELLMEGELEPLFPHELYPVVRARDGRDTLIAFYARRVVTVAMKPGGRLLLVNATESPRLVLEFAEPVASPDSETCACTGERAMAAGPRRFEGLQVVDVPVGGTACLSF